jgi:hypothetical protein
MAQDCSFFTFLLRVTVLIIRKNCRFYINVDGLDANTNLKLPGFFILSNSRLFVQFLCLIIVNTKFQ